MIYFVGQLRNEKLFLVSDLFRGEFDFSLWGYVGIERTNNPKDVISFIGEPNQVGYSLKKYDTLFVQDSSIERKIWPLAEQFSYFMPEETYNKLFGEVNLSPKVLCFDIEAATSAGETLSAEKHEICMIGLNFYDTETGQNEIVIIDEGNEKRTITKFLKFVSKYDPDIIAGYFSLTFDAPFILKRMEVLGIDFPDELHRVSLDKLPLRYLHATHPYRVNRTREILEKREKRKLTDEYVIGKIREAEKENQAKGRTNDAQLSFGFGRVHYDIYNSVVLDAQAITRVKNRKMKTIAEYYKSKDIFDIPEEQKADMKTLYKTDRQTMAKYLESDMRQTRFLFDIYYPQYSSQAQMVCTSFDAIVNSKGRAPFAKMFMAKSFIKEGIYPYKRNIVRHSAMFRNLTEDGKFKGAYVDIKKFGRFRSTAKVDVGSMYPSIIISFNISPETVRYLGTEPLVIAKESSFEHTIDKMVIRNGYYPIVLKERTDDYMVISIPDDKVGKYINFRIDLSTIGIIPKTIVPLLEKRKHIRKKEMAKIEKEHPDKSYKNLREWKVLDSTQNNLKIASNSIYGIMGNAYFEVGDLPCAMLVTAFGRELSHFMTSFFGENAIEIDTDGIYISGSIDINELNSRIDKVLTEKYKKFPIKQRIALELEIENVPSLFVAAKTYALKKEDGIETKGSALRGSSKSRFYEQSISMIIKEVLDWKPTEEIREFANHLMYSDIWKPEDFKMSLHVTKEEEEYTYEPGINSTAEVVLAEDSALDIQDVVKKVDLAVRKSLSSAAAKLNCEQILSMSPVGNMPFAINGFSPLAYWNKESKKLIMRCKKANNPETVAKTIEEVLITANEIMKKVSMPSIEKKMPLSIRILSLARKEGISVFKGESIEYYYALGPSPVQMFNKKNLKKYPINKQWYQERLDLFVRKVLGYIDNQERVTLF